MFRPSKYQEAIFDFIKSGKGNASISAVAGSGKTTTLLQALEHIPSTNRVVFLAFNKSIAEELAERAPDYVDCKTTHSLGFQAINKSLGRKKVDAFKIRNLLDQMVEEGSVDKNFARTNGYAVSRLISLAKAEGIVPEGLGNALAEDTEKTWMDIIHDYDLDMGSGDMDSSQKSAHLAEIVTLSRHLLKLSIECQSTLDFDDQIYWAAIMPAVTFPKYNFIFVDEAQDMSTIQIAFLQKLAVRKSRVITCGDEKQCQPKGTKVALEGGGTKDISKIVAGDRVVSYRRDKKYFAGVTKDAREVAEVASRDYTGLLYTVKTDSGKVSKCTDSHKWIARFNLDKKKSNIHVVYLMRQKNKYRIGWCKLFNDGYGSIHLFHRARVEKADAWILKVCYSKQEASLWESIISSTYGIPLVMFEETTGNTIYTKKFLDTVFKNVPNLEDKATSCLTDHGRNIKYPLYTYSERNSKRTRNTVFEIQACNLLSDLMSIPVFSGTRLVTEEGITVTCKKVEKLKVYSLDVMTNHTYVSNGMATCNSIYRFRGSTSNSMQQIENAFSSVKLPLSITYRCPKKVVDEAKKFVPHIESAPNALPGAVLEIAGFFPATNFYPGDMILCRTTAPLIKTAYGLISMRIPARVAGRDIGKGLTSLIRKLKAKSLTDLWEKLSAWRDKETARLLRQDAESDLTSIEDKYECISIFLSNTNSSDISQLVSEIERFFDDKDEKIDSMVTLSTVHRAKGLEADRVFILDYHKMPSRYAKSPEAVQQERNIMYVAITRAKKVLHYIRTENIQFSRGGGQ